MNDEQIPPQKWDMFLTDGRRKITHALSSRKGCLAGYSQIFFSLVESLVFNPYRFSHCHWIWATLPNNIINRYQYLPAENVKQMKQIQ